MKINKRNLVASNDVDNDSEISTVYGDMITFIMVLFILLFVLSHNDKQDDTFFVQMRLKFGAPQIEQKDVLTSESLLVSQLQGYIKEEKLDNVAQILVDEQKIKLLLFPTVLFDSGKARLKPRGQKILRNLGDILKGIKNPIMVEGHTDNVPIHTEKYDSNWVLSFHRAYEVVKFMMKHHDLSPKNLSALGYGEYQPIAPNDTPDNRAKNRRIEINIVRLSRADVGDDGI